MIEPSPFTEQNGAATVAEEELPELELVPLEPEPEHGFDIVEQAKLKRGERVLLFNELGGLLRAATERVIDGSHATKAKVARKSKQFVIGTMVALAWGGSGSKPAEAVDWGRHLPGIVSAGSRIGGQILAQKAERHAQTARFLAEAPRRVERLSDRIGDLDGRIVAAVEAFKRAPSDASRQRIQWDIDRLRYARAEAIDELLWIQGQLAEAQKRGMTAQSEAQKAGTAELGAQIADTIDREASWASMWGW